MSDSINLIVGKEAFDQLDRLNEKLGISHKEFLKLYKASQEVSKNPVAIDVPGGFEKRVKTSTDLLQKMNEQQKETERINHTLIESNKKLQTQIDNLKNSYQGNAKVQTEAEKLQRKLIQSQDRLNETRSEEFKEIVKNRDAANENTRALRRQDSLYGKISLKLTKTSKEYKELALRKQLLNNLSEEEVKRMTVLENRLDRYGDALKKADARTGNYSRNVGNYKSGFDGLGMSVAQLSREMPAFANSMQTGFMALSNNIPILVDEINNLKTANKELIAQGKPAQSVTKQVLSALISWQTALSVGVVLLTVYGDEVVDWISSLFKANNALDASKRAQKDYNNALNETRASMELEKVQLRTLIDIIGDEAVSREKRNDAVKLLQQEYPDLLQNLTTENSKSLEIAESIDKITEALENKAKVQAAEGLITEKAQQLFEKRLEAENQYKKSIEEIPALLQQQQQANNAYARGITDTSVDISKNQAIMENKAEKRREESISKAEKDFNAYRDTLVEIYKDIPNLMDILGEGDKNSKTLKDAKKILEGSVKAYEAIILELKEKRDRLATTTAEYAKYNSQIEEAEENIRRLTTAQKELVQYSGEGTAAGSFGSENDINAFQQHLRDKKAADSEEIKLEEDKQDALLYLRKLGADNLVDLTDDQLEAVKSAMELELNLHRDFEQAKKDLAFSTIESIADARVQSVEEEIQANRRKWSEVLANDQLSEEQRAYLEAQREKEQIKLEDKKRKREKEAFLIKQGLALAEIAIDLAKTISAINLAAASIDAITLGIGGAAYRAVNIPMAIGTAAAQAGVVVAQTVPQFKEGHLQGNYEGPALINDAPGGNFREVLERPDGSIYLPKKRNVVVGMKRGDKVHKNYDSYLGAKGLDDIMRATILTSMANQHENLTAAQAQAEFDKALTVESIEQSIERGFKNVKMNMKNEIINDNSELLRELRRARRIDI